MRIGILTFHCAHNYGAVLQAYALQEALCELGHEVEVIDYKPAYLTNRYSCRLSFGETGRTGIMRGLSLLKALLSWVFHFPRKFVRYRKFEHFIENELVLSKQKFVSPFVLNNQYDIYVLGSDQIWNSEITGTLDAAFIGDFKRRSGATVFSYAASMSGFSLQEKELARFGKVLSGFSAIGVREGKIAEFMNEKFHLNAQIVLDPTLLVTNSLWQRLAHSVKYTNEKYVLVYAFAKEKECARMAQVIAGEIGAKVLFLVGKAAVYAKTNVLDMASPAQFVSLFSRAQFVITSSYHGTAFAISFNKPFYSILLNRASDLRQRSLLVSLGLEERFVPADVDLPYSLIDYKSVNVKLDELRKNSREFLMKNSEIYPTN